MAILNTDPKNFTKISDETFNIEWKDSHISNYDSFRLRVLCPCAECRGGHGGKIGDNTKHINQPITINEFHTVGRYAINFIFSDGHRVGIYPFDYLRKICPCDVCKEEASVNYKF